MSPAKLQHGCASWPDSAPAPAGQPVEAEGVEGDGQDAQQAGGPQGAARPGARSLLFRPCLHSRTDWIAQPLSNVWRGRLFALRVVRCALNWGCRLPWCQVRSLGRGGGWGPLRRAPIQHLDMKGRPGLLRTVLEQQETRGLTRADDLSRLLPSEVPGPSMRLCCTTFHSHSADATCTALRCMCTRIMWWT